jgi:hypothetical protein
MTPFEVRQTVIVELLAETADEAQEKAYKIVSNSLVGVNRWVDGADTRVYKIVDGKRVTP